MNRVAHTFSTRNVKRACKALIKKNKAGQRAFRDRDLYRTLVRGDDLVSFRVSLRETDLMVQALQELSEETKDLVLTHRLPLEEYIKGHPAFLTSLEPLEAELSAPRVVRRMASAGRAAGVGPMAAVAGAIAELVGAGLTALSREVIVENGGDLYLAGRRERVAAVYTADRELGARLGLRVVPGDGGLGICTSSGRIGHSLSLGEASTATIVAPSAALADAAATAVGNCVRGKDGIEAGLERAGAIAGVTGAVIVHDGRFGAWGDVEIAALGEGGTS